MRNLWKSFLAIGLLMLLLQAAGPGEAKKIKKVLKELKKLKKYAYLLAANKKKLYAIPFPMPMPVFVKRQQIYTQVPIIPRYVSHPSAASYGAPAYTSESSASASYELMSGSYAPEVRVPSAQSSSSSAAAAYSKGYSAPSRKKHSPSAAQSSSVLSEMASQYLGASGAKYLSQIAGLLGQASPAMMGGGGSGGAGGANRDLLSKLLNGQARVLSPTALLSAIKRPNMAKPYSQEQHEQQQQQQQQQQPEQEQQDQDSKSHQSHHSSSSASGSSSNSQASVQYDDVTTSKPEHSSSSSSSSSENKPSASEVYRNAIGYRHPRAPYGAMVNPYQLQAMLGQTMVSPMAAAAAMAAAAGRAQALQRAPMMMRSPLMMPPMDAYDGSNQIDSASSQQQDPQEMSASSPQEHEQVSSEYPAGAYLALLKQRQLQHHLQEAALQKLQRQQLLARQQEALKLALLREQEVAARLAESRQILVRAHQLGLPLHFKQPVA